MVLVLILLSAIALVVVSLNQRRTLQAADKAREERRRMRTEMLGGNRSAGIEPG
jgi:cell division protein FtsL